MILTSIQHLIVLEGADGGGRRAEVAVADKDDIRLRPRLLPVRQSVPSTWEERVAQHLCHTGDVLRRRDIRVALALGVFCHTRASHKFAGHSFEHSLSFGHTILALLPPRKHSSCLPWTFRWAPSSIAGSWRLPKRPTFPQWKMRRKLVHRVCTFEVRIAVTHYTGSTAVCGCGLEHCQKSRSLFGTLQSQRDTARHLDARPRLPIRAVCTCRGGESYANNKPTRTFDSHRACAGRSFPALSISLTVTMLSRPI